MNYSKALDSPREHGGLNPLGFLGGAIREIFFVAVAVGGAGSLESSRLTKLNLMTVVQLPCRLEHDITNRHFMCIITDYFYLFDILFSDRYIYGEGVAPRRGVSSQSVAGNLLSIFLGLI